jgi:hypothetical protein
VVTGSNARVVILFPGALGDLILAMGALAAVRARHAGAHVTLAVRDPLRALAATTGVADTIASLDGADAIGLFGGSTLPAWFGEKPIVYGWVGTRDAGVAARLRSHAHRAKLFSVIRDEGSEHAAVAYLRQVGANGAVAAWRWPSALASARAADVRAAIDRPLLAMHAGAGARRKRWSLDGFVDLAKRWCVGVVRSSRSPGRPRRGRRRSRARRGAPSTGAADVAACSARRVCGQRQRRQPPGRRSARRASRCSARRRPADGRAALDRAAQAGGPFADGIATPRRSRAWDALERHGCLDKLQGQIALRLVVVSVHIFRARRADRPE